MGRDDTVLLLTHSRDYFTIDRVAEALRERGARPYRLDTDLFPSRVRLSARLGGPAESGAVHRVESESGSLVLEDVRAVWTRRIWEPELPDELEARLRDACARESRAALDGFLDALHDARWVNPRAADRAALDKCAQLRLAREVGLPVPRTLVTNDPDEARSFFDELDGRVVAKLLTPLSVSMDRAPLFVPTSEVRAEDLEQAEGLRHAPMVFQERVPKELELRVACVGAELFAGAIDASRSERGRTDWRGAAPGEARWERGEVPGETADGLRRLMRRLGLVFGAVDLIRRPDGEHVFLEVNPGGEWGMLERDLELPISVALADALTGGKEGTP